MLSGELAEILELSPPRNENTRCFTGGVSVTFVFGIMICLDAPECMIFMHGALR
ncbi:hypothetical protein EDD53_0001 [Pacificibacter maritimus]|uniref:Uncharacterized protein n=1 Tax=Pacificibacter maritimus TaxID=762213 RepID=A0A3N4VD77_9RHOB|nr:hypothetical protein EDD53_0001 [Pacificibacter maritimus]